MSELERVLAKYRRRKNLEQSIKWVSRQEAAQLLNVSIQRVNQLVKEGRLRTLDKGRRGSLNPVREEDVVGYSRKPKGRPKLNSAQNRAITTVKTKFGFKLYQNVIYEHPTEFGYCARVPVKIIRFGPKKVLVEATDGRGQKKELWVYPEQLESKAKKGEQTSLFIRYQRGEYCALTICTPFQWNRYLNRWKKIMTNGSGYLTSSGKTVSPDEFYNDYFLKAFTVTPITKIMAARFSRFLGGRSFGKFPEYRVD